MKQKIRIGTRESLLAVAQAEMLKQHIEQNHPDIQVQLIKMKTAGDRILDKPLALTGGKGLFVKELSLALANGQIDLAVHSLKDMPMEESKDFPVLGYSRREVPNDALVLGKDSKEGEVPQVIGTSSPRRSVQLRQLFPCCQINPVRGNVITRLAKLDCGEFDALVLAAAGLIRTGLGHRISRLFSEEEMLPAAGQGILAVQGSMAFDQSLLEGFFDADAAWQALAERSFVRALNGGCSAPVAAFARTDKNTLTLTGMSAFDETDVGDGSGIAEKQRIQKISGRTDASVRNAAQERAEKRKTEGKNGAGAPRAAITGPKEEAVQLGEALAEYFLTGKKTDETE